MMENEALYEAIKFDNLWENKFVFNTPRSSSSIFENVVGNGKEYGAPFLVKCSLYKGLSSFVGFSRLWKEHILINIT